MPMNAEYPMWFAVTRANLVFIALVFIAKDG
jgi:hypothetical protein